jgi:hypothetical protein
MTTTTESPVREFIGTIPGPINAEKIAKVPDTRWIISSGMRSTSVPYGRLYAIDSSSLTVQEIYPYQASENRDAKIYGAVSASLDPLEFEPHGLDILKQADGSYKLYVVNHGGRESVEIFDLDVEGSTPALTWKGDVILPRGTWPNDVAPLADGGFIVSNTADPDANGLEQGMARMFEGVETNGAVEWHPGGECTEVAGSAMAGANGVVATQDGKTVFIAGWRNKNIVRLLRDGDSVQVDAVQLDILVDNLTRTPDGAVLAAGAYNTTPSQIFTCFGSKDHCFFPSKVVRVDADTLEATVVVEYGPETFGLGTTAMEVNGEIWVSSARAAGIARFAPRAN